MHLEEVSKVLKSYSETQKICQRLLIQFWLNCVKLKLAQIPMMSVIGTHNAHSRMGIQADRMEQLPRDFTQEDQFSPTKGREVES